MDVLSSYMVYTFWPSGVNPLSSLSQSSTLSRGILRYRGVGCILGQQYCHVGFFLVYSCIMKDSNNCQKNPKVQNTALQQDDQQHSHQLPVVLVMWFVSLTHITLHVTLYIASLAIVDVKIEICAVLILFPPLSLQRLHNSLLGLVEIIVTVMTMNTLQSLTFQQQGCTINIR